MNEPGIDLTGKLIIKVALGDDIRRILITNEDITYDELVLMMQRVYRGKLNSTDDIVIKYKDEDNDLITIFDSSDLSFAIQCSRILKITLFVNSKPEPLQTDEIKMIKNEVKHIRDTCTKLLDRLDERQVLEFPSSTVDTTSNTSNVTDSPRRAAAPSPRMPPPTAAGSKEFDPLSTQRSMEDQQDKVMSSFGVTNNDRAGTPDSISSIGSAGQRPPAQANPQPPPQQSPAPPHTAPQTQPQQPQQPPQAPQQVPATSMYGGMSGPQKMAPWQQQPQNQQQNATGQPSQYSGQQQQQGYPQPSQQQQQQQGYPGQQPPSSQPQSLPNSTAGASYPGGYGGYGGQPQHGQYPGPHPGQAGAPGQMGHPSQQQQQPQSYYQQQPQQPGTPGQAPPPGPGGNPYARQGPGYGSGYPRPAANYPQGYQ